MRLSPHPAVVSQTPIAVELAKMAIILLRMHHMPAMSAPIVVTMDEMNNNLIVPDKVSRQEINIVAAERIRTVDQNSTTTGNQIKQGDDKLVKPLAITFGLLGGVAVVAFFIWVLRKRRSRSDEEQSREQAQEHTTPMIEVVTDAKDSTAACKSQGGNSHINLSLCLLRFLGRF